MGVHLQGRSLDALRHGTLTCFKSLLCRLDPESRKFGLDVTFEPSCLLRSCVRIRWQFAHTTSHFLISSKILSMGILMFIMRDMDATLVDGST